MIETLLLIFPLLYIALFLFAMSEILQGKYQGALLFLIFGLPVYVTVLSIVFSNGFEAGMSYFQLAKEFIIIVIAGICALQFHGKPKFHTVDILILAFFLYTLLYVVLPVGGHGVINRMIAFKSSSFFALVYFAGRMFRAEHIYIRKYFKFILLFSIFAGCVVLIEGALDEHFQLYTGFADYNVNFLKYEASGDEGLTFTFETENGLKRFASVYANPLEFAAGTLLALAVIASLYTGDDYKLRPDNLGVIALVFTFIAILLTISRAAFVSYFAMIYLYSWLTNKKQLIYTVNFVILSGIIFLFSVTSNEALVKFIVNTINFTDSSSIGHVMDWLEGIAAIKEQPLGLGLGSSGRLAVSLGTNTGGHNQFLIVGVQTGVISMAIYLAIYISLIVTAWHWYYRLKGKANQVCLFVLLIKCGLFIPLFTSEIEASPYISYMTWFFSGLLISLIMSHKNSLTSKI